MLELYVATVLPFGARHSDALPVLENMVAPRLAKNARLHAELRRGMSRVQTRERSLHVQALALPLDWSQIERWIQFLVKGLAWHHWQISIGSDCEIKVVGLSQGREPYFNSLLRLRGADQISGNLGSSALSYEATQGTDDPRVSVWLLSVFGGLKIAAADATTSHEVSKFGVLVGPKCVAARASLMSKWLRGEGNREAAS